MMSSMSGQTNLSKEFFELVKAIGESRSKREEDRIVLNEVQVLKRSINKPKVAPRRMREFLIRTIYVEMLGHDASFAHIYAINLSQDKDLLCKKIGYLACALCLHSEHELMLLLINTVTRDLSSPNFLEVGSALTCISRLMNQEMIPALRNTILRLTTHNSEMIRKKAIMAVVRLYEISGDESTDEAKQLAERAICDPDAAVRGASLYLIDALAKTDRTLVRNLVPALVSMLKQIIDHGLPRDFDYHRVPAPWMQIKILAILGLIGEADKSASEEMYETLAAVMRIAGTVGVNVGFAISYECVRVVARIYPHAPLLEAAAASISRFITAENHNLQFVGLTGLAEIVKVDAAYAAPHQLIVVDCLEDSDDTLKFKTLELLCRMGNPRNVKVIVEKVLAHLKVSTDKHIRRELTHRAIYLCERYAPDKEWYLDTIITILQCARELLPVDTGHSLMRLLADGPSGEAKQDELFRQFAVNRFIRIAEETSASQPHSRVTAQVASWTLGEYGSLVTVDGYSLSDTCFAIANIADWDTNDAETAAFVVSAITKLYSRHHRQIPDATVTQVLTKCLLHTSGCTEVDQRCNELRQLVLQKHRKLLKKLYPPEDVCGAVSAAETLADDFDWKLSFLDGYCDQAIRKGCLPYVPLARRENHKNGIHKTAEVGAFDPGMNSTPPGQRTASGLKFAPYASPKRLFETVAEFNKQTGFGGVNDSGDVTAAVGGIIGDGSTDPSSCHLQYNSSGGGGGGTEDGFRCRPIVSTTALAGANHSSSTNDPLTDFVVKGPAPWSASGYRTTVHTSANGIDYRAAAAALATAATPHRTDTTTAAACGHNGGGVSSTFRRSPQSSSTHKAAAAAAEVKSERHRTAAAIFDGLSGAGGVGTVEHKSFSLKKGGQYGKGGGQIESTTYSNKQHRSNDSSSEARISSASAAVPDTAVEAPDITSDVDGRGGPSPISCDLLDLESCGSETGGGGGDAGGGNFGGGIGHHSKNTRDGLLLATGCSQQQSVRTNLSSLPHEDQVRRDISRENPHRTTTTTTTTGRGGGGVPPSTTAISDLSFLENVCDPNACSSKATDGSAATNKWSNAAGGLPGTTATTAAVTTLGGEGKSFSQLLQRKYCQTDLVKSHGLEALRVTTEEIAPAWSTLPYQKSFEVQIVRSPLHCNTCPALMQTLQSTLNFHVVDVIGSEGIAAAISTKGSYRNHRIFLHCVLPTAASAESAAATASTTIAAGFNIRADCQGLISLVEVAIRDLATAAAAPVTCNSSSSAINNISSGAPPPPSMPPRLTFVSRTEK